MTFCYNAPFQTEKVGVWVSSFSRSLKLSKVSPPSLRNTSVKSGIEQHIFKTFFFFFPCFSCLFVFLFSNKIIFKELHILSLCSEQPCKWSFLWMLNKYVCTHLPWLWIQHCRHKPTSYCHEGLSSLLDNQFGIQSSKTGMLVGNFKLWVVIFSPSWSGSLSNSWLDWVQKAQHFRGSNQ